MAAIKTHTNDLEFITAIAREAGDIGMKFFGSDENDVWYKNGSSPVSQADKEIDAFLKQKFAENRADYGWLSEETEDTSDRLNKSKVAIVDPIDGTRGFLSGSSQWCISIAIAENSLITSGVLYCPASDQLYAADKGSGLRTANVEPSEKSDLPPHKVTGSNKIIEILRGSNIDEIDVVDFIPSLALRLAKVATGEIDGAFARPGAQEWDVAAADLILQEAGCSLLDGEANRLTYNNDSVAIPALIAAKESDHDTMKALAKSVGFIQ